MSDSPTIRIAFGANTRPARMKATFGQGPTLRFALGRPHRDDNTRMNTAFRTGPDVRLATFDLPAVHKSLSQQPTIRLAHKEAKGDNTLRGARGQPKIPQTLAPALLVSYVYLEGFKKNQADYVYRDWMMDSGAYSAYNSGEVIDLEKYIEDCHRLRAEDPTLKEIIGLDVIGDAAGSVKNNFYMKEKGVDIVPVFHYGEDWGILRDYCAAFKKVGLSCRFGETMEQSYWFYDQCFARSCPKRFHSFGWIGEPVMMRYPFHSGDSTSWEIGPCSFGNWKTYGKMSVRGSTQNLRTQIEWYLGLEA